MRILYQGLLRSPASWARVGRAYVAGLLERGHDVAVVSPRGFLFDAAFEAPAAPELTARAARESHEDALGLGFLHPTTLERFVGARRANLFVWEADRVPPEWIAPLAELDAIIVPSRFTRDALVRGGAPPERVEVAPYGFTPGPPARCPADDEPFRFVSIVSPHHRKGVRELLLAYVAAFRARDPVQLTIKTTYDPGARRGRPSRFEIATWRHLREETGLDRAGAPELRIDVGSVPDDAMARVFDGARVAVQPSWGESFGLAALEAMARGLPVIATGRGGHVEFMPAGPDLVPFELVEDERGVYEPAPGARIAKPSIDAIASRMRWHFENREASRELGETQRACVEHLTWSSATAALEEILERVAGG